MTQTAYLMHRLNPGLRLAYSADDILRRLQAGGTSLWLPFGMQRNVPDAGTKWEVSSESIALELAQRLNAERLVMVSCVPDRKASLGQLSEAGIVDVRFAALSNERGVPKRRGSSRQARVGAGFVVGGGAS